MFVCRGKENPNVPGKSSGGSSSTYIPQWKGKFHGHAYISRQNAMGFLSMPHHPHDSTAVPFREVNLGQKPPRRSSGLGKLD